MKVDIDQHQNLRLQEIFSGVILETANGNSIGICMRDDTLEINVLPRGENTNNWWRVNMDTGQISRLGEGHDIDISLTKHRHSHKEIENGPAKA